MGYIISNNVFDCRKDKIDYGEENTDRRRCCFHADDD